MPHRNLAGMALRSAILLLIVVSPLWGNPLLDIRPGRASRDVMHGLLGNPSSQGPVEQYEAVPSGLKQVRAWYDSEGRLKYARVTLVRSLRPDIACLLFDSPGIPQVTEGNPFGPADEGRGNTEHYAGRGIHFYIDGGIVREIWLTTPNADIAAIAAEARALEGAIDKEAAAPAESPNVPAKRLQVSAVWCGDSGGQEDAREINACARVETAGLKGRLITMRVLLFDTKGNPVMDKSTGRPFSGGFTDTLLHDNSSWQEATVQVPLANLVLPQDGAFRLRWEALLPELGACSEIVISAGPLSPLAGVTRSLTVSNVRVEAGSRDAEQGLWLYADVNANGFNGQVLKGWANLRLADGRKVLSKDKGCADNEDALAVGSQDTIRYDTAHWNPFRLFLPYGAFDLAAGTTHRVIVTYIAACQQVGSRAEQEIVISLPLSKP